MDIHVAIITLISQQNYKISNYFGVHLTAAGMLYPALIFALAGTVDRKNNDNKHKRIDNIGPL